MVVGKNERMSNLYCDTHKSITEKSSETSIHTCKKFYLQKKMTKRTLIEDININTVCYNSIIND